MRRLSVLTLLTCATALGTPVSAGAVIVPQQGMAGVRLGMSEAQVRAVLGPPTSATNPPTEILGRYRLLRYGSISISLFQGPAGRVFTISTTGRAQRTVRGIGVGSRESAVRSLVPGVSCRTEFGYRHCQRGASLAGRTVTDFAISRAGYVTRVTIGHVID